jgi:hypothetical protein
MDIIKIELKKITREETLLLQLVSELWNYLSAFSSRSFVDFHKGILTQANYFWYIIH